MNTPVDRGHKFYYNGELDPSIVERMMGTERRNGEMYEVKIHGNLNVVRGKDLTNFLTSTSAMSAIDHEKNRYVKGLVSGPIKEKVFLAGDSGDKEIVVSDLSEESYVLRIQYPDGFSSIHRELGGCKVAEKIFELYEEGIESYVAPTGAGGEK